MTSPPLVLSIQSHVAFGHVGNAAAMFPLQRLGLQPVAVHTVQFSNHTGYGAHTGQVFSADHVRDVLSGLRARGVLARCAAVLSGYLGDAAIGAAILDVVAEIRAQRGDLLYCCDPVMGDVGRGVFVRPDIPAFLRDHAVPRADLVTPNQFEFEQLIGRPLRDRADAVAAACALGPPRVVITSVRTPDVPAGEVETLAVDARTGDAWQVRTPYLPLEPLPNGMGDVFSAIVLARLMGGATLPLALAHTVAALYGLLRRTAPGARDLPLVAAQDEIGAPGQSFEAVAVRA